MKKKAFVIPASSLFLHFITDSSSAQETADAIQNGNRLQVITQAVIQFLLQIKLSQIVYIIFAIVSLLGLLLCLLRHKKIAHLIETERNKVIDSETMRSAQTIRELVSEK